MKKSLPRSHDPLHTMRRFLLDTYLEWRKDSPELMAAGLGYFMLFSLPPLLIIGAAVVGTLFKEVNLDAIVQKLTPFLGTEAVSSLLSWLALAGGQGKEKATLFSVIILWLAGTRVFTQLQAALNIIWKAPIPKPLGFFRGLLGTSIRRVVVVLGVCFFLLLAFLSETLLAFLNKKTGDYLPILGGIYFWQILSFFASLVLLTLLVAAIYRFVPDARIEWQDVWPGAAVTAGFLAIGKTVIAFYLGFESLTTAYGAASSVIVIMIWIYFAAQIFFFGAKLTWLYALRYGSQSNGNG